MRPFFRSALLLSLSAPSVAQQTLTEYPAFNSETFVVDDPFQPSLPPLGVSETIPFVGDGQVTNLEMGLSIQWTVQINLLENTTGQSGFFSYHPPAISYGPNGPHCNVYDQEPLQPVAIYAGPGQVVNLTSTVNHSVSFAGSSFDPGCSETWDWTSLGAFTAPGAHGFLTGPDGSLITSPPNVTVFAQISGLIAAEWMPMSTITESRVFDNEVFASLELPHFDLDLGLQDPFTIDGSLLILDVDLDTRCEFEVEFTHTGPQPASLNLFQTILALPVEGDCAAYDTGVLAGFSPQVNAGELGSMMIDSQLGFQFSGSDFNPGCHPNPWYWRNLSLKPDPFSNGLVFLGGGGMFDIVSNSGMVTVGGLVTAEWAPNELPHWNVCDGNSISPTTLTPTGDWERLWLMQTGVPEDFNLLLRSETATNVVPPSGLCVGANSQIVRINDSLRIGGQPFRFPYDPGLSGTIQYFQSWFRDGSNGTQTGECIGVSIP